MMTTRIGLENKRAARSRNSPDKSPSDRAIESIAQIEQATRPGAVAPGPSVQRSYPMGRQRSFHSVPRGFVWLMVASECQCTAGYSAIRSVPVQSFNDRRFSRSDLPHVIRAHRPEQNVERSRPASASGSSRQSSGGAGSNGNSTHTA